MGSRANKAAMKTKAETLANSDGWIEKGPKSIQRLAPLILRIKLPKSSLSNAHAATGKSSKIPKI